MIERLFEESAVDSETAAKIVKFIGVDFDEMSVQPLYGKVKDIISFYGSKPDGLSIIRTLVAGKNVDRITHLHEYAGIRQELDEMVESFQLRRGYLSKEEIIQERNEIKELSGEARLYEK